MSTVTLRPDGRYQTTFQLNGNRTYLYGHSEAEVRRKLREVQKGALQQGGGLPSSGRMTLDDLITQFITTATLRPRTRMDYQKWQRAYISPHLGKVPLKSLTPLHLQRLYATLAEGRVRAPSQVHGLLHRALKLAVLWRLIPSSPADGVLKPGYHPREKDLWTLDQVRAFFHAAQGEHYFPIWKLILYSGCRISEVLSLTWNEVDWEGQSILIRRNVQRVSGQWVEQGPKTRSGYRSVTLPPEAMADLADRRRGGGLVFGTRSGKTTDARNVQRRLQLAVTRAGLPPITLHELRHLHATILLAAKVPVPEVSARLGHANPQVTMTVYAHALRGAGQLATRAIGAALSPDLDKVPLI